MADMPTEWEIPQAEKRRRLKLVSEQLEATGVLVHSGGQRLSSLLAADKAKSGMNSPHCLMSGVGGEQCS